MIHPTFQPTQAEAEKIAYDLALLYAKSQYDRATQRGIPTHAGESEDIAELMFIQKRFLFALKQYSAFTAAHLKGAYDVIDPDSRPSL